MQETDLAQLPHERTINAQQLLGINGVRLIQKYPDLVVVRSQHVDRVFELIGDVELVRIEHDNDHVGTLCEPAKQPATTLKNPWRPQLDGIS